MLSPVPLRNPPADPADALSRLLKLLNFRTRVFFSGRFCGDTDYDRINVPAQFHFVLEGQLLVSDAQTGTSREVCAPALVAFPSSNPHRLEASHFGGCRLLCCYVLPVDAVSAALVRALPNPLYLDLKPHPSLATLSGLLAAEAASGLPGQDEAMALHLRSVILAVIRVALREGHLAPSMLPVLTDARLARAVTGFLERPGARWTIASLARLAGMSRSAFAATFTRVAGATPQQFLSAVRFDLAARLLDQGVPAKAVARAVGYASSSSFARSVRQSRSRALGPPPQCDQ